jgi:HAD superfamily hydrolase (TIGR01509 family)
MFDAIFFDLDGTLIDTESLALVAGLRAFAEAGYPVGTEFMHGLVGLDEPSGAAVIAAAFPDLDQTALNLTWRAGFRTAMAQGLQMKSGARDLLALLSHPVAVVTSSGRDSAHHKLGLVGLSDHFAEVITLDDVTAAKPAPDPYLLAAERFGVAPARCLVFEDSEAGAEAAHRAGCRVVQVPDIVPSQGRWAHHLAETLLEGARAAGLRV